MAHHKKIPEKIQIFIRENCIECKSYTGKTLRFGELKSRWDCHHYENYDHKECYEWYVKFPVLYTEVSFFTTKSRMCHLLYDEKKCIIVYSEELIVSVHSDRRLFKKTTYDSSLNVIEEKILDTILEPQKKYRVYVGSQYTFIIQQESFFSLVITTYDHWANYENRVKIHRLPCNLIMKWDLASRLYHKTKIFYPYIIVRTLGRGEIIWSLRGMKSVNIGHSKNIMPISSGLHEHINIKRREIRFITYEETFFCVDNKIYNEDLKEFEYCEFHLSDEAVLLDSSDGLLAYEDKGRFIILGIDAEKKNRYQVPYVYTKNKEEKLTGVSGNNKYFEFNLGLAE